MEWRGRRESSNVITLKDEFSAQIGLVSRGVNKDGQTLVLLPTDINNNCDPTNILMHMLRQFNAAGSGDGRASEVATQAAQHCNTLVDQFRAVAAEEGLTVSGEPNRDNGLHADKPAAASTPDTAIGLMNDAISRFPPNPTFGQSDLPSTPFNDTQRSRPRPGDLRAP